jgi:hypothetical protein
VFYLLYLWVLQYQNNLFNMAAKVKLVAPTADVACRLLNYLAVDYSGAVNGGKIVGASKYAEVREFAGSDIERIAAVPATLAKAQLLLMTDELAAKTATKASVIEVAHGAQALSGDLLAYGSMPLRLRTDQQRHLWTKSRLTRQMPVRAPAGMGSKIAEHPPDPDRRRGELRHSGDGPDGGYSACGHDAAQRCAHTRTCSSAPRVQSVVKL